MAGGIEMIIPVQIYTVKCDKCGKEGSDDEYLGWNCIQYVEECAIESGWHKDDDEHYCPNCYELDDEGEVVV
jgi:hypothetical protein